MKIFAGNVRLLAALSLLAICQTVSAHTVNLAFRCEPNGSVTFFAATYHSLFTPTGGLIIDGTTYAFTGITDPLPNDVDGVSGFYSSFNESGVKWQTVNVSGLTPGVHTITTTMQTAVEDPRGTVGSWTTEINCCEVVTMTFTTASGSPSNYTEQGITVESSYPFGGHIHLTGSSISNHSACCSEPYRFSAGGQLFTVVSIDVLNGVTGSFRSPTGAAVSITGPGTINFPAAGWSGISEFYWDQPTGTTTIDNVTLALCDHPNTPPTVTCPAPKIVECDSQNGTQVTLTAAVGDADGDALRATWSVDGVAVQTDNVGSGATVSLTRSFPLGTSQVQITVTDGEDMDACSTSVTVVDTVAPLIICAGDVVLPNDPGECSAVNPGLPAPKVTDTCTSVTYTNDAPAVFPMETTVVTWTATDAAGNTATCTQLVTVVDVEPPMIVCPPDVVVAHDPGDCVATGVALGTPLVTDNCGATVSDNAPVVFPLGETVVTWTATDAAGNSAACEQLVMVTNATPVAHAGSDRTVECDAHDGTLVTLDGSQSYDPDVGDILTLQWSAVGIDFDDPTSPNPTAAFPKGSTTVTLTVADQCGDMASSDVIIVVQDTTAPEITAMDMTPNALWPPNHDMVPVFVDMLVADSCEDPASLLMSCRVSSDEPDDSNGDGSSTGDVDGQDGYTAAVPMTLTWNASTGRWEGLLYLRAERDGAGDGRKYSLVAEAMDMSGNFTRATACVVVPHSQKGGKAK